MIHHSNSLFHLLAMYYSPLALPHKIAAHNSSLEEKKEIHRQNMLHVRPFMRDYIFRSGKLMLYCYGLFLLFTTILPFLYLAITAALGILLAMLHTVFLIFMQQSVENIAAQLKPPKE